MIKRIAVLALFLLSLGSNSYGQTDPEQKIRYKITGKVLATSSDISVPYATVQLFDTKHKTLSVAVTDINGLFIIYAKASGSYHLKFDAMGYTSDSLAVTITESLHDIGTIRLTEGQQLTGVTVSAKRLIMKDEGDRFVYDVTQDPEAKRVKMMDIMRKVPNLSVNSQGKLTYLDEDVYTILINGKKNEMINGTRQFTMRLIKGDVMSRIELILPNTPENKSDKTIINIKLARDLPEGYAADINVTGNNRNVYSGNADFVAKIDNVYLSTTYGIGYTNSPKVNSLTVKENLNTAAEVVRQENSSVSYNKDVSHQLNIGSSFKLSKKDDINISLNTSKSIDKSFQDIATTNYSDLSSIINTQTSNSVNKNNSQPRLNGSLSYSRKIKDIDLTFGYSLKDEKNNVNLLTFKYDTPEETYSNKRSAGQDNSTLDQSASISFERYRDMSELINFSATYTNRRYQNSSVLNVWDYNEDETYSYNYSQEGLDYTQQIYNAKGGYSISRKKFSLSFSLSAEKMINKGRFNKDDMLSSALDYEDLIILPRVAVSYNFPKRLKMYLRYQTRTLRPSISYLNPYEDASDPDNISMGNPDLKAEYAHGFSLMCSKIFGNYTSLSFIAGAEFINNAIERTTTINEENTSITTYGNLGRENRYSMSASLSLMPFKGFRVKNSIAVNSQMYHNKSTGLSNSVTGYSYRCNLNYTLSKKSQLSGSINVSPLMAAAQTKTVGYNTSIRFNYSQTLVKDKLFLNISLDDPFSKHRFLKNTIGNDSFIMTTSREQLGRVLGFRLEWNFGRLKDKGESKNKIKGPEDLSRPSLD